MKLTTDTVEPITSISASNTLAPNPSFPVTRIVYFGTPEVAVAPLQALYASGVTIDLVVTHPDARHGRGSELSPSAVKLAATKLGIPVSHDLNDVAVFAKARTHLGVVVAYGKLLPMSLLTLIPMVNIHFSLLPKWRGAAPVERALLAGDKITGVSIIRVAKELDTGDIYRQETVHIDLNETADMLRNSLCALSIPLLLDFIHNGPGEGDPQIGETSYASKITANDLLFDFTKSAKQLVRITRVGVGHTIFRGKRLNIIAARAMTISGEYQSGSFIKTTTEGILVATSDGAICLHQVQPEGKSVLEARSWAHGAHLQSNELFG